MTGDASARYPLGYGRAWRQARTDGGLMTWNVAAPAKSQRKRSGEPEMPEAFREREVGAESGGGLAELLDAGGIEVA